MAQNAETSDKKVDMKEELSDLNIEEGPIEEESNLKGDYGNVAILLFLYILQGIPLGISSAVRILLQNRGVSYKEQALFSLASYPFTSSLHLTY